MIGFEYRGKSTEDIIDTPLQMVNINGIDGLSTSRSKIEGERTISRFITNEYGTIHEPLSFSYALIKEDGNPFTDEEQAIVESWLKSYKLSSELRITDCQEYSYSYYGLFIQTEWIQGNGGMFAVNFTFQVNGLYPFIHVESEVWPRDPNEETGFPIADDEFFVYCQTSELEEYVYPIIRVQAQNFDTNSSFEIEAMTDGGQTFQLTTQQVINVAIDCQRCRVYSYVNTSEGEHEVTQFRFSDLGWEDVDRVYWPRLLPGQNKFKVLSGDVKISVSYDAPYMKVGGWLV